MEYVGKELIFGYCSYTLNEIQGVVTGLGDMCTYLNVFKYVKDIFVSYNFFLVRFKKNFILEGNSIMLYQIIVVKLQEILISYLEICKIN